MRIETRIHQYYRPDGKPLELAWDIEWRKRNSRGWRHYARAFSPEEAEEIRQICKTCNGRYPTVYETRNGLWKYKVVHDFSRGEGSYDIYFKRPFEKWCWHHLKYNEAEAVRNCDEMCKKKSPKDTPRTGMLKYPHKVWKTIESTVLCLRYPFLYPRNRWTGKNYNNWKLDDLIKKTFDESHICTNQVEFHKGLSDDELYQMQHPKYRITSFPKAVKCRFLKIYRWILEVIHCVPTYTEMDAMEYGWRKAFGKQLLKDVKTELKSKGLLHKYRITQIKEKWGELCWYDSGGTKELFDILRKYERLSYRTCYNCGKPAKYRTVRGWILPYCEDCISQDDLDDRNYRTVKENETGWVEIGICDR